MIELIMKKKHNNQFFKRKKKIRATHFIIILVFYFTNTIESFIKICIVPNTYNNFYLGAYNIYARFDQWIVVFVMVFWFLLVSKTNKCFAVDHRFTKDDEKNKN